MSTITPPCYWRCEFCPAVFPTFEDTEAHEKNCKETVDEEVAVGRNEALSQKKSKWQEGGRTLFKMTEKVSGNLLALFHIATTLGGIGAFSVLTRFVSLEGNYSWAHEKHILCDLMEQVVVKKCAEEMRLLSKAFNQFRNAPSHHPYRQHEESLLTLSTQLEQISTLFLSLCNALNRSNDSFPQEMMHLKKHAAESTIPSLLKVARKLKGLITFLQLQAQGSTKLFYSKSRAVHAVVKHRKGTHARGEAIQELVEMGLVPSSYALYNAIKVFEKEHRIMETWWTTMTDKKVRYRNKRYKGDIYLPVIRISCYQNNDLKQLGKPIFDRSDDGKWNIKRLYGPAKMTCLFTCSEKEYSNGFDRLYFSPKQFPTPIDLETAGKSSNAVFKSLRSCI